MINMPILHCFCLQIDCGHQDSKRVAEDVSSQIEVSERTMKKIDQAREAYRQEKYILSPEDGTSSRRSSN